MSKINNWVMDIEDFCNGYSYGGTRYSILMK